MSESKTRCNLCNRPPGGRHTYRCARGRRFAKSFFEKQRQKREARWRAGYPIADIRDLVAGPIKATILPPSSARHHYRI